MGRKAQTGERNWHRSKRSTTVIDDAAEYSCVYHSTEVFRLDKKTGRVFLNDGGWDSVTTRARINDCAGALGLDLGIHRSKGETVVTCNGVTYPFSGTLECQPEAWRYEYAPGVIQYFDHETRHFCVEVDATSTERFDDRHGAYEYARSIGRVAS